MGNLGIDLGTTNTVVSRSYQDSEGRLNTEIVQIGQFYNDNWEKFDSLPSVVYFDQDGSISDTPGSILVGREAKRQRTQDKRNAISNSKRFMGTQHTWSINGITYSAKDIAAMILQHCKKTIEREGNMNYETVVITVPASFNPEQISDTLKAAKQAGFADDQVIIKHEPTAALLSFIDQESRKSIRDRFMDFSTRKRVLVFDLGGGTCDTSVIDVQTNGSSLHFTEIGIGRYQELGGIDFDYHLANGLLNTFYQTNHILEGQISESEQATLFDKLLIAAETLKEKLSSNIYTKLTMHEDTDPETVQVRLNIPDFYQNKPYRITLTKAEYDAYTKDLYIDNQIRYKKFEDMEKHKNILSVIRKTLEDYDIPKDSIDYIFLTGGMSKFLSIKEQVSAYLKKPVIIPENPMDAVARGASIYQYYKIREDKQNSSRSAKTSTSSAPKEGIVDNMMLAEAVLLDMQEGLPRVIIPKKTVVPYSGEILGEFFTTSPSGVRLNIYAAEDELDSSMRIQKCIERRFQFPVESGTPFDIKYRINENKAIDMTIILNDIHRQEIDISIRSNLKITEQNYQLIMED